MLIPMNTTKIINTLSTTDIPLTTLALTIISLCRRLEVEDITRVYLTAEEYLEIEQYL